MKWAYLPIMLILAFVYTKYSFNDLKSSDLVSTSPLSREPASAEEVKLKVPSLKRVPASILYKHLGEAGLGENFKKISEFKGSIVGNPHVESFGFVVDDKGKSFFSLRDFSEVSTGIYMHDIFAHLISSKTIDRKMSWINYFDAYKNGLQGRRHVYSFYIEKGLEEASWDAQKIFEENVTADAPFEFTQLKSTYHKLDGPQKALVENSLKKKYPKIQFFDLYEGNLIKDYHVLARIRPQDKIDWIILSESSLCGYDQAFSPKGKSVSFDKRFAIIKADIFDERLTESLEAITIGEKNYLIKFADQFSSKLLLGQIPPDDYRDIILDEAYVLGKIHKRSLGNKADAYIKTWATIPGSVIDEKIVELKYHLKNLQE